MLLYLSLTAVATLLSLFVTGRRSRGKGGGIWMFLLIALLATFSSIRKGIGIDYYSYLSLFRRLMDDKHVHSELGFNMLVKAIVSVLGDPQWVFAVFAWATVTVFLVAYFQQSPNFSIAVYYYLVLGYYFYSFNSVRYYFAVGLSLFAFRYFQEKRYGLYLVLILLGTLFHKSILFALPVHWVSCWPVRSRRQGVNRLLLLNVLGVIAYVFKDLVRAVIFKIYPGYEGSMFDDNHISVLNILICVLIILLMLIKLKDPDSGDPKYRYYFNGICIAQVIYTYCSFIPEVSRVAYYVMVGAPIAIAELIHNGRTRQERTFLTMVLGTVFLLAFLYIMAVSYVQDSPGLLPYRTIFS